ncbi:MAG: hypothetical protein Q9211_001706 [Gyalolechia sp. 1 TL-2023]
MYLTRFLCLFRVAHAYLSSKSDGVTKDPRLDPANFLPEDVITRDVCVVGGGSSGTYTAIRLQDFGKSVVVVEKQKELGGHAATYRDPDTGGTIDITVISFGHLDEVKKHFQRFDVPLKPFLIAPRPPDYVDFATGETINFTAPDQAAVGAAFQRYSAELSKYPKLQYGFYLDYPVPEDLLLPFGDFVRKYSLEALVLTMFGFGQGYSPLLELSTLYIFKFFNARFLDSLSRGFLTTERSNVGELYEKAAQKLGGDVLFNSSVMAMDRSAASGPVRLLLETPSGRKLVLARKVVSTIPPLTNNLQGYDLSREERFLFKQFFNNAYSAGVLRNTQLPADAGFQSAEPDKPYGVPELPGIYFLGPSPVNGLFQVYYGSPYKLTADRVKADILTSIKRIQHARGINATSPPQFVAFEDHTPFNLMVSNEDIQGGFYDRLNKLQGQRNTFYNGAAFQSHDSSVLWQSTERLLPKILESLQ